MSRLWTPDDDASLCRMTADEVPDKQIAFALGRTYDAVSARRKKLGAVKAPPPSRWTDAERARFLTLAEAGMSAATIARVIGRSRKAVGSYADSRGVRLHGQRRHGAPRPAETDECATSAVRAAAACDEYLAALRRHATPLASIQFREGVPKTFAADHTRTLVGSHGAACADFAGRAE